MAFENELLVAELTVQRAARATTKVHHTIPDMGTSSKPDASPVSIADFAAQALIVAAIRHAFPGDAIIGEEDAGPLRENPALAQRVWELVAETTLDDDESNALIGDVPASMEEMLANIDAGGSGSGAGKEGRMWIVDPVDGTKGFIIRGQYCVCLALVVDGVQALGAFACPQVGYKPDGPWETEEFLDTAKPEVGCIVSAVRGEGTHVRPISTGALLPGRPVPRRTPPPGGLSKLRFTECIYSSTPRFQNWDLMSSDFDNDDDDNAWEWSAINTWATQLRYVGLALGAFDAMLRAPLPGGEFLYNVWDHAGGSLVCAEAGVRATDFWNKELDVTAGRKLENNFGYMAAVEGAHADLLKAARRAMATESRLQELLDPTLLVGDDGEGV